MKTQAVIDHFGAKVKVARALDISPSAVGQWKTIVPFYSAMQLQALTNGALRVDHNDYDKGGKRREPESARSAA